MIGAPAFAGPRRTKRGPNVHGYIHPERRGHHAYDGVRLASQVDCVADDLRGAANALCQKS